ncbi:MAG: hypothetical protein R3Y08_03860 [Rikenellaceae bacterium]
MFLILLTIIIVVAVVVTRHNKNSEFRSILRYRGETTPRLHISVVIDSNYNVDYISSMLAIDSVNYELVVVGDFNTNKGSLYALSQRFGLVKTHYIPTTHEERESIKGLYRSFRKHYNRLLVVDSGTAEREELLKIGTMVAKYDYILKIAPNRILRADAIDNLLLELAIQSEGSVESIESMLLERFSLRSRDSILSHRSKRKNAASGKRIKIDYRILKRATRLEDRQL